MNTWQTSAFISATMRDVYEHKDVPSRLFLFDYGDLEGAHGILIWEDGRQERMTLAPDAFRTYYVRSTQTNSPNSK